jgi:exonuclease III
MLRNLAADILCVQETKIVRDVLTADVAIVDGFNAYFAFAKSRKGTSCFARAMRVSSRDSSFTRSFIVPD